MQQSNGIPWFLDDSSGREPARDHRPPRVGPDFPDPTPHIDFDPPPQHQFPQPRGFPGDLDRDNDDGGERGRERAFHDHDRDRDSEHHQHQQPPSRKNLPPPSGFRIPIASNAEFPPLNQVGPPPCVDANGVSPVYVGSAIFDDSVHPCKIAPSVHPPCRVPYGGTERAHHGRYDLLPITPDMEWVPTRNGEVPPGRRPVEGGYESDGEKLYHALGNIDGVNVPGKTGKHLVS